MSAKLDVGKWGKPRDSRAEKTTERPVQKEEPVVWTPETTQPTKLNVSNWSSRRDSRLETFEERKRQTEQIEREKETEREMQRIQEQTKRPWIVVPLLGGIGNQLFQYAFGISIATARNKNVGFTIWQCEDRWRPMGYQLDAFVNDIKLFPRSAEKEPFFLDSGMSFGFQPAAYTTPLVTYHGYWQTEKYFNIDLVREKIVFRYPLGDQSKRVAEAIATAGRASAFLHIRRGEDYLRLGQGEGHHGVLSMDYYHEAIRRIREVYEDAHFFVFGDNPDWIRENFSRTNCTVVNHVKPDTPNIHEDMHLMSLCQNGAIANSSFSWWSAWLGDQNKSNRLIFAPKNWFGDVGMRMTDTKDIVPNRWVKLEG